MKRIDCEQLLLEYESSNNIEFKVMSKKEKVWEIQLRFSVNEPIVPSKFDINYMIPLIDIHNVWMPGSGYNAGLTTNYIPLSSSISTYAPAVSLFSTKGVNALTIAYSDSINLIKFSGEVHEETCSWHGKISLFDGISDKMSDYEHVLRIDLRKIPQFEAVGDVVKWWETFNYLSPMKTVEKSKLPMYSTWYSMHQQVSSIAMIEQCKIASELGCKAIIIDDGWQTEDGNRGYAYCGDWEVCTSKIPDMRELVEELHQINIDVLIWYCVPLIGYKSKKWEELKGMLLKQDYNNQGCGILDPRYKVVREYIITTYEKAVADWNLDGLKLDFIDCFKLYDETPKELKEGMDYISVSEATYKLFTELMKRLKNIKSDIMIEFRQGYIGPTMRVYGNIFRAVDCPSDPFINRVRVLNLRLTSGNTVVHSDMIRWNDNDSNESVAYHLWSTVFSVAQISVDLTTLSAEKKSIVENFLAFSAQNVDMLIDTELKLYNPESGFSYAVAEKNDKCLIATYSKEFICVPNKKMITLVNAGVNDTVAIDFSQTFASYDYKIIDIYGNVRVQGVAANLHEIYNINTGERIEFVIL